MEFVIGGFLLGFICAALVGALYFLWDAHNALIKVERELSHGSTEVSEVRRGRA